MVKVYLYGKDQIYEPCIELDDGTIITEPGIVMALIKALTKKGLISQSDLKAELKPG